MAEANKKRPPTRIVTGAVRISYVHLASQRIDEDTGEPIGYGCQVLVSKKDEKTLKAMKIAIQHAAIKFAKGDKAKAAKLLKHPKFHKPLRNPALEDMEGEQYKGMLFMSAKSKEQPAMLLKNGTRLEDEKDILKHFYSGVWVNCSLSFYPFDTKGNKGVAVGLNSLIKNKDDTRLDGRVDAEDELSEFIDEDDTSALDEADDDDMDLGLDDDDDDMDVGGDDDDDDDEDDFDLDL